MEIIASNNDNLLMTIRSAIEDISETEGINYLQEYFSPSKPFYTGSHFESLEADNNPEERITGSDLYAVATLNTPIKRQAAMGILITNADEINALLSKVTNKKLGTLTSAEFSEHLGPASPAMRLWDSLRRNNMPRDEKWGIGPTRASKIMARKRPHLIPINDRVIREVIDKRPSESDWELWWEALTVDDYLEKRAQKLRESINQPELSTLRVLDVLLWMSGTKGFHSK